MPFVSIFFKEFSQTTMLKENQKEVAAKVYSSLKVSTYSAILG